MVVLALLWSSGPTDMKWLTLSSIAAPFLFLPLALLLPLALVVRSRGLRGAVLVLLGLFALLFGARFLPPRPASAEGMLTLRVVTFNQLYTNERVDAALDALSAQDADIVALQELSPAVADALQTRLEDVYPYADFRPSQETEGIGLFSRYPITSVAYEWNPQVQRATVNVRGVDVTVLNLHAPAPYATGSTGPFFTAYDPQQREPRFEVLLGRIDEATGPLVVLGDFNLSDREWRYNDLSARLTDVFRATTRGFGFTYPNQMRVRGLPVPPLVRIDYVWVGGGVVPVDAKVVCDGGSDHCMVVAELGVPGEVREAETDKDAAEPSSQNVAGSSTKSPTENPFTITINFTAAPTPDTTGGAMVGTP